MLSALYHQTFGTFPTDIIPLTPAGSNRQYFRVIGDAVVIGVIGTSVAENEAFIYLSDNFSTKKLPVPKVIATSSDHLAYLQDDLGDTSLFSVRTDISLLEKAVKRLPDLQFVGGDGLDFTKCYPVESFDKQSILWDLNYFKYCFLNITGTHYNEKGLRLNLEALQPGYLLVIVQHSCIVISKAGM